MKIHSERIEEKFIAAFDENVNAVFGEDMIKTGDSRDFNHMGYFALTYTYLPHDYTVRLEHDRAFIDIEIKVSDNARASFCQITKYKIEIYPSFKEEDIRRAVLLLKELLEENNLYSKNAEGIKKIKRE